MSGVRDAINLQWEVAVLIVITVLVIFDFGKHAVSTREFWLLIPMGWGIVSYLYEGERRRVIRQLLEKARDFGK